MSNEEITIKVNGTIATLLDDLSYVKKALSSADKTYDKGQKDVWEFIKKVHEMGYGNVIDVFPEINGLIGCEVVNIVEKYTPQEALAKLEAYEKKIEVGDVVRLKGSDKEYVVTTIDEDRCSEIYCGVSKDGRWFSQCNVEKTGKHIDIQSVLQQIGDNDVSKSM